MYRSTVKSFFKDTNTVSASYAMPIMQRLESFGLVRFIWRPRKKVEIGKDYYVYTCYTWKLTRLGRNCFDGRGCDKCQVKYICYTN
jgi:hypothetical protein